jgi:hypothetical protein
MSEFDKRDFKMSRETVKEVLEYPLSGDVLQRDEFMQRRKINKETLNRFGYRTLFDENTGQPVAHYAPVTKQGEIVGFIRRDLRLPKKQAWSCIGEVSVECDFIGTNTLPDNKRRLYVVEGFYDVLAAYQALRFSAYNMKRATPIEPAIVSLTCGIGMEGANASQQASNNIKLFDGYQEVVLAFDNDEAGQKGVEVVSLCLPDVKHVEFTRKDPCEYLKEGLQEELARQLAFEVKDFKPQVVITGGIDFDELYKPLKKGIYLPFLPKTMDYLHGLREREMTLVLAPPNVGKCLGEGTLVRMFDGTLKPVEDIKTGDKLMGIDSKPRIVTSVTSGVDTLYKVKQNKGMDYIVNSAHILSLKASKSDGAVKKGDILNENVVEYMNSTNNHKKIFKGWRTGYDLPEHEYQHWYLLGLWIADGGTDNPKIWVNDNDKPIIDWLKANYNIGHISSGRGCKGYYVKDMVDNLPIKNEKIIDESLLISSRKQRLELLAGIIDGDGYCYGHGIEIVQKRKSVASFIVKLCHTLGVHVTTSTKKVGSTKYIRLFITGEALEDVPLKLERKKPSRTKSTLSVLDIECVGEGRYYGFTLEGSDRLFLLEDGTVTHNTSVCKEIGYFLVKSGKRVGHIFLEEDLAKTQQTYIALDNNVPLPKFRENPKVVDKEAAKKSYDELVNTDRVFWLDDREGKLTSESLLNTLNWLALKGVEYIVFDHISFVVGGDSNTNERKYIDNLLTEMAAFVKKTGVHLIVVAHVKRTGFKAPRNKDGSTKYPYWFELTQDDARGSGAFEQLSWNMLAIEPEFLAKGARGRMRIKILKNREWGWLGITDYLTMHPTTGRIVLADNEE